MDGGEDSAPMGILDDYRRHLRRRHLAASSITRYLTDLRAFERYMEPRDICAASHDDVEFFLDSRNLKARSRTRWLSELHRFYQWAVDRDRCPLDPTVTIDRPRLSRLLPRPIPDDDLALAIRVAGPRMRAWIVLASFAGLRAAEIAHLAHDWIEPTALRVTGKGGHQRIVPMHPAVRDALDSCHLARHGEVFRKEDGTPFTPKDVSRRASAYFEGIGLNYTIHQCRHAFATRTLRATGNLRAVQELCGHQDLATTAIYTGVSVADLEDVIAAVPPIEFNPVRG